MTTTKYGQKLTKNVGAEEAAEVGEFLRLLLVVHRLISGGLSGASE